MAAVEVHKFARCITCHAWSRDRSMLAFCPNNNEVHIYALLQGKWEKLHVLQKVLMHMIKLVLNWIRFDGEDFLERFRNKRNASWLLETVYV